MLGGTRNSNRARVVGANDYTRYAPDGAANLLGAVNDVIAWWRLCVTHLAISAQHITLLTSPEVPRMPWRPAEARMY